MGILLDLAKCLPSHPNEEILEEYAFRRLPEALAAPVEEHLLICEHCQDQVVETEWFVSAMKAAGRQPDLAASPARAVDQVGRDRRNVKLFRLAGSRTSLASVLGLALVMFLAVRKSPPEPPAPVTLSSMRGLNSLAAAPAGKPLQLVIESPDLGQELVSANNYRLELVDAAGSPVWQGAVTATQSKLVAPMSKPLGRGVYWVRLYGADSQLLREFGLSVR